MKNHTLLLPRMAGANIRKNGSIYFPYIGVRSEERRVGKECG